MKPPWNPGTVPPDSNRLVIGLYRHPVLAEWEEVRFFRYDGAEDGWCDLDSPDLTSQAPDAWIDLPEVPK